MSHRSCWTRWHAGTLWDKPPSVQLTVGELLPRFRSALRCRQECISSLSLLCYSPLHAAKAAIEWSGASHSHTAHRASGSQYGDTQCHHPSAAAAMSRRAAASASAALVADRYSFASLPAADRHPSFSVRLPHLLVSFPPYATFDCSAPQSCPRCLP